MTEEERFKNSEYWRDFWKKQSLIYMIEIQKLNKALRRKNLNIARLNRAVVVEQAKRKALQTDGRI